MKTPSAVEKIGPSMRHDVDAPARHHAGLTAVPALPRPAAMSERVSHEASWRVALRQFGERIRRRGVAVVMVALLHGLLLAVALMSRRYDTAVFPAEPLQVRMLDEVADVPDEAPIPLPEVTMERPSIDIVPPPDVQIMEPRPTAITVAVQSTPTPASSLPTETPVNPIVAPRFDADYLSNPSPIYPTISKRSGEHGTVMLRVRVTASGAAAEVRIEHTSGSSRLDEAAIAAVERWRFVPARRGTEPVEAWVLVPIEFELRRS